MKIYFHGLKINFHVVKIVFRRVKKGQTLLCRQCLALMRLKMMAVPYLSFMSFQPSIIVPEGTMVGVWLLPFETMDLRETCSVMY